MVCKKSIVLKFLLLISGFLLLPVSMTYSQDAPSKSILILHSFHKGHVWNDSISEGIDAMFAENRTPSVNTGIHYEYMDIERANSPGHLQNLYDFLKLKYRNSRFDVIIATDDSAFRFLLNYQKKLFPDTPVVFCGVNYFEEFEMFGHERFTGVVERIDILKTVRTALRLHPKTEKILVVVDKTDTSIATIKTFVKNFQYFKNPSMFTFIGALSMEELHNKLRSLSPGTVVLFVNFTIDKTGRKFSMQEGLERIAKECPVPIYSFWDCYLGNGIVGGMMASGSAHGRKAAEITLRILNGEPVQSIPVFKESLNRHMFDYQYMQRFKIKESLLPEEARIINIPFSFYSEYKKLVWTIISSITGLGLIILILLLNTFKRKRVEKSLKYYSNQLKILHKIDRAILEGNFSPKTTQDVLHYVRNLYSYQWASVVVFDFKKQTATVVAMDTDSENKITDGASFPINDFNPDALRTGKRMTSDGLEPSQNSFLAKVFLKEEEIKGYISIPLISNEELIGSLNLSNCSKPTHLNSKNIDIIEEVAASLAVAIQSVRLLQATMKNEKELERLSAKVFEMQESTCRKISFELHDEIGQSLTAATLNLAAMEKMIPAGSGHKLKGVLTDTEAIINRLSEQAHDLSLNLWPPMLRDFGLVPTLRWYLDRIAEKVDIRIEFDASDFPERPAEEIETAVYRLAQEALNNILKHAHAARVDISITLKHNGMIFFMVEDDGGGFDLEETFSSDKMNDKLGLLGMRQRIAFLEGTLNIWSCINKGTCISAEIPWQERMTHA